MEQEIKTKNSPQLKPLSEIIGDLKLEEVKRIISDVEEMLKANVEMLPIAGQHFEIEGESIQQFVALHNDKLDKWIAKKREQLILEDVEATGMVNLSVEDVVSGKYDFAKITASYKKYLDSSKSKQKRVKKTTQEIQKTAPAEAAIKPKRSKKTEIGKEDAQLLPERSDLKIGNE